MENTCPEDFGGECGNTGWTDQGGTKENMIMLTNQVKAAAIKVKEL